MKKALSSILFLAVATGAMAQSTETAYFTDGYLYGHEMNPAKGNDQNYISFPALGNLNVDVQGSLGVQDVVYNVNGRTALFTNPNVSTSEFMKNIKDKNDFNLGVKMQLMSIGFKGMGGYNTISIGARAETSVRVPGTLFRMAKEGFTNDTYDFSDLNAHADAYAELALGHSHDINDKLRVGAKVKVLLGVANVDANVKKATLTLGEDSYKAVVDADVQASVKGLRYETESTMRGPEGQEKKHTYVNGVDIDDFSPINGLGFGVDLGAEYKITDDFTISAAIVDLGFINYNNNMLATTGGEKKFDTNKYTFNVNDDAPNSFDNETDKLMEDLALLYELQDKGDQGSRSVGLGATMNIGAEYNLVGDKALTVGGLLTKRFGTYGWYNGTLSLNAAPTKWLSASVSGSYGSYGAGFGWMLNLHPKGFSVFVGMDQILGSLSKQGIPLSNKGNINVGVNFPF